jgi:hypothetical protein
LGRHERTMRVIHASLSTLRPVFLTLGISLVLPPAAGAQTSQDRGTIIGTVLDPVGVAAPKIAIAARSIDGQTVRLATSESTGRYTLADLPAGTYDISVNMTGLRAYERKNVRVEPASTAVVDIRLEEGTQLSTLGEDALGFEADRVRHAPPAGPAPRTADGKPDLSGVWWSPVTVLPGTPQWLPRAQQIARQRQADMLKDSPQSRCLPAAVLRRGPLVEFVQSKTILIEISDDDSPGFHQIYLAGHEHPQEPDLLWYGDSVGRWEGDTLIVDRVNFVGEVWLDQQAHPITDKLHVIERYRRPDLGHLEAEITVEDPGVLARPWTLKRVSELAPTEEIREFICNENNSDPPHLVGR